MRFQKKHKWGKDRRFLWRFGHYACSGNCCAEFPNFALRNAHDVRFHPQIAYVMQDVKPGFFYRLFHYLYLCLYGWALFFTIDFPLWIADRN